MTFPMAGHCAAFVDVGSVAECIIVVFCKVRAGVVYVDKLIENIISIAVFIRSVNDRFQPIWDRKERIGCKKKVDNS